MKNFESQFLTNSAELPGGLEAGERVMADRQTKGFGASLATAVESLAAPQKAAAEAISQFNRGTDGDLHDTLMAVDKADVSLKFFVTVRNKCLEAYREVMRMGS
jgi:flagellar hook-basal body complex protein FliE